MADHTIKLEPPMVQVGRLDYVFHVYVDGKKQGELRISEGGLDWWPKSAQKHKCVKTWEQLRQFMES